MNSKKNDLMIELLNERLSTVRVGVLIKGISEIDPANVSHILSDTLGRKLKCSIVGYSKSELHENENVEISYNIILKLQLNGGVSLL